MKSAILLLLAIQSAELPIPAEPPVFRTTAQQAPVRATIDAAAWTEGLWEGEVFGGPVEHRIMSALGGQMPGMVRLSRDRQVTFYEFSTFMEVDGTLTYRNRHFDPALVAQQDRRDYVDRSLVRHDRDNLYFDGITFRREGPDRMTVVFVLPGENGQQAKHVVRYVRKAR